jgi:hypothetical protein
MTYDEFWHKDMRLLEVCQKSYYRNISYVAWLHGQYDNVAYSIALSNAFSKKGVKPLEYPEWKDPMEKFEKPKITKANLENEFRKQQVEQQAWLFNR